MRTDRRAVRADHLLFVNKKAQLQQLCNSINICMRKQTQSTITASQALDNNFITNAMAMDNAYKFTSKIVGSPAYWEGQKNDAFAMIRQLGCFSLFVTLSAAETQWPELLQILKRTVDKENVDLDYVKTLDFMEKARLIRSDPVTCALYFEHRFKELKKTWYQKDGPLAGYEIAHLYYRIEFQHRGSPHVHMVIWLKNAPQYDPNDDTCEERITTFIDSIATTSLDEKDLEGIEDVIKYQYHKCTASCKKIIHGKVKCRFNAPFAPMDKTRILHPIPEEYELTKEESKKMRDVLQKMNELLENEGSLLVSFDDFLAKLNIQLDDYLFALRSQLKSRKVFIKRHPKSYRINQYNHKVLSLMRSNMDIQFVLDPYSCIQYVVDYINKSQRGLSKLLKDCIEETKNGQLSIREKLKAVSLTLYNGSEISAQEAAWLRLQLPMAKSSVQVEFINTSSTLVSICYSFFFLGLIRGFMGSYNKFN